MIQLTEKIKFIKVPFQWNHQKILNFKGINIRNCILLTLWARLTEPTPPNKLSLYLGVWTLSGELKGLMKMIKVTYLSWIHTKIEYLPYI